MANRTETIKVRVTPATKQKFKSYIEDTGEFPSVSQLLRASANAHIEGDDQRTADIDVEQITNAVKIALGDVTERLDRIEHEVERVDTAVQPTEEDIDDLADDIAVELPVMDDSSEFRDTHEIMEERAQSGLSDFEFTREMSTVGFWADYVDADENKARRALSRAASWYPDVQWTYDDDMGERRYYRTSEAE